MLSNKYILSVIIIMGLLFTIKNSFAQQVEIDSASNKPRKITLNEFRKRLNRATTLLQTKELSAIADSDHVNIMMCLNTIFLNNFDKSFNDTRCKQLLSIADKKDYRHNIVKVYPDWVFNRGMGQYFPKLRMELYGTPNLYATFIVLK